MNKCYTVLYNLCYFKGSALSENTGKRIGIEDESCPWEEYAKILVLSTILTTLIELYLIWQWNSNTAKIKDGIKYNIKRNTKGTVLSQQMTWPTNTNTRKIMSKQNIEELSRGAQSNIATLVRHL